MLRLVADEDVPKSTVVMLRNKGFEVLDVRDIGLRGRSDDEIFAFAQQMQAVILTCDMGFGNVLRYPLGSHAGIIIVHYPNEMSCSAVNGHTQEVFDGLSAEEIKGSLVILEPGRVRRRKAG